MIYREVLLSASPSSDIRPRPTYKIFKKDLMSTLIVFMMLPNTYGDGCAGVKARLVDVWESYMSFSHTSREVVCLNGVTKCFGDIFVHGPDWTSRTIVIIKWGLTAIISIPLHLCLLRPAQPYLTSHHPTNTHTHTHPFILVHPSFSLHTLKLSCTSEAL